MTYYVFIQNEKINGTGQCRQLTEGVLNIEIDFDTYNNIEKYIYQDGAIILNPNYEAEQIQKEAERIGKLTCTKRVFALILQEIGIDYLTMLKPLIESNSQAQLEWDLCIELERKNVLLDVMARQLGIVPEYLDLIFMYANNELTQEEFISKISLIEQEKIND